MSQFEAFYEGARIEPEGLDPKGLMDLEIGRYMARGRQLQAQAVREAFAGAFHTLRRGLWRITGLVLAPGKREAINTRPALG